MEQALFGKLQDNKNIASLRRQSKEEFFATKRRGRKMKTSVCFSQTFQRSSSQISFDELSLICDSKQSILNEQLQSTFGFEQPLAFKAKPHRRKHMKKQIKQTENCSQQNLVRQNRFFALTECKKLVNQQLLEKTQRQQLQGKSREFSIEDFVILQKLGEGTYSEVFRAIQKQSGFLCALKIMSKQRLKQQYFQDNLVREIKICSYLDHPNITKIYGHFHDETYIYLVCEYSTGNNLFHLLMNQPPFKLKKGMMTDKVINIIAQLTSAMAYMHNHKIIHRDIKPENVLLTMNDTVKLCDFGWSVHTPNSEMKSTLCGTILYLAPQIVSQQDYDEAVDVWAIGVLTYQLMTDQNPFRITKPSDIKKIIKEEVRFQGLRNREAVSFISKALQKEPSVRPSIYELSHHPFLSGFKQNYNFQL